MSKEFTEKAEQAAAARTETAREAASATPITASTDGGEAAELPRGEGHPQPTPGAVDDSTTAMPKLGTPSGAPHDLEVQWELAEEMLEIFGGFPTGDEEQLDDGTWEDFYAHVIEQPGGNETFQTNTARQSGENMTPTTTTTSNGWDRKHARVM